MAKSESGSDWLGSSEEATIIEEEGQLAIDAYQTEDEIVIIAPIAGVNPEDLEIAITDEVITIRGERRRFDTINPENYFAQECYWGPFSRSYLLPVIVETDQTQAGLKNGILTISIPKQKKAKPKIIKVSSTE